MSSTMRAAILVACCAAWATANQCCDNQDKKFCHIACKMYIGSCCHLTPQIIKEKPWRAKGRCCCGAMYDSGWNKQCSGEDITPNTHWFPNPGKSALFAQNIVQQMRIAQGSGNSTVVQPQGAEQSCFMWKDWDGCVAKTMQQGTLPGTNAACETISCSRAKTCPGAPQPHRTGDWCNIKAWAAHCTSGWATGAACHRLGASGTESGASVDVIDISFADKSYQNFFGEDFSYNQRNNEAKYFDVGNHGGREALRVRLYQGDKTAWKGNPSCPRTELRPRTRDVLKTETDYTAKFEYQLQQYTAPYKFAMMQLYGGAPRNRPNIFLRFGAHSKHQYNILCEQCGGAGHELEIPGDAMDDIGKWVTWRIEFRLSTGPHGHLRFYHNGNQVYNYNGKTSDGSGHNWKTGIYTQGEPECETRNTVAFLSNLKIQPTAVALTNATSAGAGSDLGTSAVLI